MALKLSELRKQAKDMGISPAVIRQATTAEELQSVIEDNATHDGGTKVAPRKKVAKKTVARKAPVRKNVTRSKIAARKATTARKAAVGNSVRKASTPAKSRKSGTAKRSSNSTERTSAYVPKGGRTTLGTEYVVEYDDFEGWNPRPGSPPDRIIKAMKRFKGDRDKVFNFLLPNISDFMGSKKRDGKKRTKVEMEAMLRYRISRTAWDFAMRTGQHEAAANRVKYGTGGTGQGVWKPAKARKAAVARKSAPARKSAVKTRTAQRAAGGRKKATARKRTTTRR